MDIEQKNEVIESKTVVKLNPWTTIMFKPRATMRYILNTNPPAGKVLLLICLVIFTSLLTNEDQTISIDSFSIELFWHFILILAIGIPVIYYLVPLFFRWIGNILGGKGTTKEIRYVVGYTCIPSIYSFLLLMIFQIIESFFFEISTLPFEILIMSISIWTFIVSLKCLAEAHKFSAWRALGTMMIGWAIIFVSVLLIILAIFLIR
ncbi:Yip1 family protein [Chengkuizengella marina]|uniref:YIP1 family protein n=1 Tax=Chengkuizengella marina TaxID=2507566 RepID=A0A6N9Q8R7_9BACL|nr:Yip1 family protein [Chengkuizengella marina]NBI30994.1 YIP1 family protein [Chengkuizengella marina]